jgi:hypothetical protein
MASSYNSGYFYQLHDPSLHNIDHGLGSAAPTRQISLVSSFDGSAGSVSYGLGTTGISPILDLIGMHNAEQELNALTSRQAKLSLLTDVGRRYPGYPSPLSPTFDATQLFPSPTSDTGSAIATPRAGSPALQMGSPVVRTASPMSIDGSDMCGPSRRCLSHAYEQYAAIPGLVPSFISSEKFAWEGMTFVPEARIGSISPAQLRSPPASHAGSSLSPTSPPRVVSPRTVMLKNMIGKQALQCLSHQPNYATQVSPPTIYPAPAYYNTFFPTPPPSLSSASPPPPGISIANGLEVNTASPLSATGTMLSYTSNRSVDSGLLAVRPLSEAQVAEYRFWRPCGRRACAFGCGAGCEGEVTAARRLFRGVSDELGEEEEKGEGGEADKEKEKDMERERRARMYSGFRFELRERDGVADV